MVTAQGADRANRGEKIVEDIAPVTKHVDDDAASIFFPVIPGGALRRLPISFENPIAKFSANRKDPSEKTVFDQGLQFSQTREKQFVLDDAILQARSGGQFGKFSGGAQIVSDRFFTIDVLSRGDRGFDGRRPAPRSLGYRNRFPHLDPTGPRQGWWSRG